MVFAGICVAFGAKAPGTLRIAQCIFEWFPYLVAMVPLAALISYFWAKPARPHRPRRPYYPRPYRAKVQFDYRHLRRSLPAVVGMSVLMVPFVLFGFCFVLVFFDQYLENSTIWLTCLLVSLGCSLYVIGMRRKVVRPITNPPARTIRCTPFRRPVSLFRVGLAELTMVVFQAGLFGAVLFSGLFDGLFGRSYFTDNLTALLGLQIAYLCFGLLFANEVRAEGERKGWPASHRVVLLGMFLFVFAPILILSGFAYGFGPYAIVVVTGVGLIFWFTWHFVSNLVGEGPPEFRLRTRLPVPSAVGRHRGSERRTAAQEER